MKCAAAHGNNFGRMGKSAHATCVPAMMWVNGGTGTRNVWTGTEKRVNGRIGARSVWTSSKQKRATRANRHTQRVDRPCDGGVTNENAWRLRGEKVCTQKARGSQLNTAGPELRGGPPAQKGIDHPRTRGVRSKRRSYKL